MNARSVLGLQVVAFGIGTAVLSYLLHLDIIWLGPFLAVSAHVVYRAACEGGDARRAEKLRSGWLHCGCRRGKQVIFGCLNCWYTTCEQHCDWSHRCPSPEQQVDEIIRRSR